MIKKCLFTFLILITVLNLVNMGSSTVTRLPGVKPGDEFEYTGNHSGNWTASIIYAWTWGRIYIEQVSGSEITYHHWILMKKVDSNDSMWANGTKQCDVETGVGAEFFPFIGANLSAGDQIYSGGEPPLTGTINETVFRSYPTGLLEVNHYQTSEKTGLGPGENNTAIQDLYWEKNTGLLVELSDNLTAMDGGSMQWIFNKIVIPEFLPLFILPIFMTITSLIVIVHGRKHSL